MFYLLEAIEEEFAQITNHSTLNYSIHLLVKKIILLLSLEEYVQSFKYCILPIQYVGRSPLSGCKLFLE
jgi:hypothetical protein